MVAVEDAQMVKPRRVTETSLNQSISSPGCIWTLLGPLLPLYVLPPSVR